jgi:CubicO group peptidase (beta-lactamase class C family)
MSNGAAWSAERLTRLHRTMAGHVERGEVPGVVTLVSRRGETHVDAIGAQTIGGTAMRRDTIFRIASLTKPVTAVAAMMLVEECRLRLDDPVDGLLPELADRRVLRSVDGRLSDTVPAHRAISLRDLLTLRLGLGHLMVADTWPIHVALKERGLLQGPPQPRSLPSQDEWIARVGSLPLMYQPGEQWLYDLGTDVLGVLISRASGQSFGDFLHERVLAPLGMKDTGFSVPPEKLARLATSYCSDPATGELQVYDGVTDSQWSTPPRFESGSGGLVSTVDDYFAFCRMLLGNGVVDGQRILSRASVELMTSDQVTFEQRRRMEMFFEGRSSWGFGLAVDTRRETLESVPGRFGWTGGLGTSAYTDPREQLIGVLLTQRMMDTPTPPAVFADFWTSTYQALGER